VVSSAVRRPGVNQRFGKATLVHIDAHRGQALLMSTPGAALADGGGIL
jgi:hypothetical protein